VSRGAALAALFLLGAGTGAGEEARLDWTHEGYGRLRAAFGEAKAKQRCVLVGLSGADS